MVPLVMRYSLVLCLLQLSLTIAIHKDIHDKVHSTQPLSDKTHYENAEDEDEPVHNLDYDHEAFLGKETAKTFDQLTPAESKERLLKIVDKIDKDADGYVTQQELEDWIQYTQKRYIRDDVDKQWKVYNPQESSRISWEEYRNSTYGAEGSEAEDSDSDTEGGTMSFQDMVRRDKRRWDRADRDGDGHLNKEEFGDFLHPEESQGMKNVVVEETMEDIDKDKDGKISLEEYIGDMYEGASEGEVEPDWVQTEREQFTNFRDKDKDGFMGPDEVRDWIMPNDYDHSIAEARHLIHEADTNKDGKLTRDEIIDKYDVFVGSQATDYGEALTRHDEF